MSEESKNRINVDLSGQVAIVTGASQGIGKACALELARNGARVACLARNADKLAATVAEIEAAGGQAVPLGPSWWAPSWAHQQCPSFLCCPPGPRVKDWDWERWRDRHNKGFVDRPMRVGVWANRLLHQIWERICTLVLLRRGDLWLLWLVFCGRLLFLALGLGVGVLPPPGLTETGGQDRMGPWA